MMDAIDVKVNYNGVISKGKLVGDGSDPDKLLIFKASNSGLLGHRWMESVGEGRWVSNLMRKYGDEVLMADEDEWVAWEEV